MENIDYSNLNLRSLKVLKLIYELGSLTAAANKLGMNQPTLSYTLDQLRQTLGDPLFVRSGRGVAPTARCHQIMPDVGEVIRSLSNLLITDQFSPAEASLDIVISCNQYELQLVAPKLIQRLNTHAPNIRLTFIQSQMNGHQQLQKGLCDLLLSPVERVYEGLYKRELFSDQYTCLTSSENRNFTAELDLETYIRSKHVEISYEGGWKPLYLSCEELRNVRLNIALRLPSVSNLIKSILGTDLILTLPNRLARTIAEDSEISPAPFDCRFTINMYWNKMTHRSMAHEWVRGQIELLAKELATCSDSSVVNRK